jgi:hypothetical protein
MFFSALPSTEQRLRLAAVARRLAAEPPDGNPLGRRHRIVTVAAR